MPTLTNAPTTTEDRFLETLRTSPDSIQFKDCIAVIEAHFDYRPTRFTNGLGDDQLCNEAGTNEGSCKVFAFASHHDLTEAETLHLFGDYYRQDVLADPNGDSHPNIRRFLRYGWKGIHYDGMALTPRQ